MQYHIDLFSAALEDDPGDTSLALVDRRVHLEQYRSRWDRYDQAIHSSIDLPPHTQRVIDGEVLACIQEVEGEKIDVTFIQLPSVSRGARRKQWVVKGLPENVSDPKMLPGLDLLVIPAVVYERQVKPSSAPSRNLILDSEMLSRFTCCSFLMDNHTLSRRWTRLCSMSTDGKGRRSRRSQSANVGWWSWWTIPTAIIAIFLCGIGEMAIWYL